MLQRIAGWLLVWSGLATGALVAIGLVFLAVFALDGGLQAAFETDAPPPGVYEQFLVLTLIALLYLFAAFVFTISLAVVQLRDGPWWAAVFALGAVAVGAGAQVAGSQAGQASFATVNLVTFLGFLGYMVATNAVGLRVRRFNAVTTGVGVAAALLVLAPILAAGLVEAGLLALALVLYGAWAVSVGLSERRQLAIGRSMPAPLQAVLQAGPGDPV